MACETFCLDDDDAFLEATMTLQSESLTAQNVRFIDTKPENLVVALAKCHNKKVLPSVNISKQTHHNTDFYFQVSGLPLINRKNLHGEKSPKTTLLLQFKNHLPYKPGDHLGVFAKNKSELVEKIIKRLKGVNDPDTSVSLQFLKETHTSNGTYHLSTLLLDIF